MIDCLLITWLTNLNEVEAHGHDGHANDHVDGTSEHLHLSSSVCLASSSRYDVTEADCCYGDEAEVSRGQCTPSLPHAKQQRPHKDVSSQDGQGDGEWHSDSLLLILLIFVSHRWVIVFDNASLRHVTFCLTMALWWWHICCNSDPNLSSNTLIK